MRNYFTLYLLIFIQTATAQQGFHLQYHPFQSQQAVCLKEAVGGGYLLGSNYTNGANKGILITRFDDSLNIVWEKTIDQAGITERMNSLTQNINGDILIAGTADSNALLIRTDSTVSNLYWNKLFNHTLFTLNRILFYSSNSYYVLGHFLSTSTFYADSLILIALDSMANILWTKSYSPGGHSNFGIELLTNSNGDLITGNIVLGPHHRGGTFGYNAANGNLLWNNYWNLDAMSTIPGGTLNALTHSHNNGFLLYGTKQIGSLGDARNYILNCGSSGNLNSWFEYNFNYWSTSYYGPDNITAILSDHNSYTIAGYMSPYKKLVVMKVDSNLSPLWSRIYEIVNISSTPIGLVQTADLGYFISGTINNKIFLAKTDSLGHTACSDSTLNVTSQPTTDFQFSGATSQVSGFTSLAYLPTINLVNPPIAIDTLCNLVNALGDFNFLNEMKIYPNPATSNLTLEIKYGNINSITVSNILGEKQFAANLSTVYRLLSIDVSSLSPGIYFLRAETEQGLITSKFIKE